MVVSLLAYARLGRLDRRVFRLLGVAPPWKVVLWLAPALFAYLLTLVDSEAAGRTYATYGGVYIVASVLWLWLIEGQRPDRWDITGAIICIAGESVRLFAPRA